MSPYEKIDFILKDKGISRRKFSRKIGIPASTFQSMMERKRGMTIEMFVLICKELGIECSSVLTDDQYVLRILPKHSF